MDKQSSTLRLRLPIPEHHHLSFCKSSVRDFKLWIANLPKANTGETARLLYHALQELNAFKTPAENRLQLLKLLRPEVLFINAQLEKHFINSSVMLDARSQKIANLCQSIQNHLTNGYKLVIAGSLEQRNSVLIVALQRTLHSMFASLVRTYQLYYPAQGIFASNCTRSMPWPANIICTPRLLSTPYSLGLLSKVLKRHTAVHCY